MPRSQPAPPSDATRLPITTVDALAAPVARDLRLTPPIRLMCYLAGRKDGARLEWTLEHGGADTVLAWHWLERNQRDFLQRAQAIRSRTEFTTAPANRELRSRLKRVEILRPEVETLRAQLRALESREALHPSALLRTPGEAHAPESLVHMRHLRKRAAEVAEARRRFDAVRLQLAREEERIAELVAVIRLAARRAVGEVARLRAHFSRRAEVAARGVSHRSVIAATALGLLEGVATLPEPGWVTRFEKDLLSQHVEHVAVPA